MWDLICIRVFFVWDDDTSDHDADDDDRWQHKRSWSRWRWQMTAQTIMMQMTMTTQAIMMQMTMTTQAIMMQMTMTDDDDNTSYHDADDDDRWQMTMTTWYITTWTSYWYLSFARIVLLNHLANLRETIYQYIMNKKRTNASQKRLHDSWNLKQTKTTQTQTQTNTTHKISNKQINTNTNTNTNSNKQNSWNLKQHYYYQ